MKQETLIKEAALAVNGGEWTLWTGLNDLKEEGQFVWSDGTKRPTLYWHTGQPDNGAFDNKSEDCIAYHEPSQLIEDQSCNNTYSFFCELPRYVDGVFVN